MFRIKICGITNADDARAAVSAGAEAIGLNFYPPSRRFVSPQQAQEIAEAVPADITAIGVFVNATASHIADSLSSVGLDGVQLHGDEPPELLARLPEDEFVIRAYRCGSDGLQSLATYLDACRQLGRAPEAVLVDADAGAAFGGSGHVADWRQVAAERSLVGELPLILAGGLTPENVADAIATVRPDGVDVASGVESSPGKKDPVKMHDFVAAARAAFDTL